MRNNRIVLALAFAAGAVSRTSAQTGPPGTFGYVLKQEVVASDPATQRVLMIYVQSEDYRFVTGELATTNLHEDTKRSQVARWHAENSWNRLHLNLEPARMANGDWFHLKRPLLSYVGPAETRPMQSRDFPLATVSNPSPPATVMAAASSRSDSNFKAEGFYYYAVASFRSSKESRLTVTPAAIQVKAGQVATLNISQAVSDATKHLIFRAKVDTLRSPAPPAGEYVRIGEAGIPAGAPFFDTGVDLDGKARQLDFLLQDAIEAATPNFGASAFSEYRAVMVVLHAPFLRGEAYFEPRPLEINGLPIKIHVSYVSSDATFGRIAHEMSHWLHVPDAYDEETGNAIADWDIMDNAKGNGQHYAWSKIVSTNYFLPPSFLLDPAANTVTVTRPALGAPPTDVTHTLRPTSTPAVPAQALRAIRIQVSDNHGYVVEARRIVPGRVSDQSIPRENIVVTQVLDSPPATVFPRNNVRLLQALRLGMDYAPDRSVKITYVRKNPGSDESYDVRVQYAAEPQPDLKITPWGNPPWETPDIWIDSPREGGGFRKDSDPPLPGNGERPWVGHENRVWVRVTNVGLADAKDVRVRFRVNSPGGIGDAGQFVSLPAATPAKFNLAAGKSIHIYTTWTPDREVHSCIAVHVDAVAGESNLDNNESQENVLDFYTGSASPWHPVSISLDVANPMPKPARVDIGVNGLPAGWKVELDKTWVTLPQKGRETVTAVITPNPTDPQCTKVVLDLHGIMRLGDVWMPYSGFTPVVKLANPIQFANTIAPFSQRGQNLNARVKGCTSPGQPNREIAIQVKGPNGKTVVHFVTTDSSGCFDKLILAPIGGTAEIKTYFAGSDCAAPTESAGTSIHPPEPFLPGRLFVGASGGSQIALLPLWRNYWGGGHVNGHLEVDVAPGWRAMVQAGYHGFFPRSASVKYAAVTHYSVLAKYHRPLIGSMQLNAFGGAGLYRSPSSTNPGMQLGAGVESAHSSNLRFFAHVTAHQTTVASQLGVMRWVDFSLGFSVRAR